MARGYSILYKFTPLPPISTARMRGVLFGTLAKYGRAMKSDFQLLVSTWRHEVQFKMNLGYRGGDLFATVVTGDDIFRYLDEGTDVRYATMHPDFVPKTSPGSLSSGPGGENQDPQYVNTMIPRPGIQARNFSVQMRERYEKAFVMEVETRIMQVLRGG